MVHLKTDKEIEFLRESSLLVGKTLAEVAKHLRPGITTLELDQLAEDFIRSHGAEPAFKGYGGFPGSLCISVNDQVVHGIPGDRELLDGDIVSIDCGTIKNGYYGDSAYTFAVGEVDEKVRLLMQRTKEALFQSVEKAVAGNRVGDIGHAVQSYVEGFGYSVVRELVGHGVGKSLHERPEIPNYGRKGTGMVLKEGMVICIEPMINLGKRTVVQENDGWTVRTADGMPSAHFELEVAVRKHKVDILTSFDYIDQVLQG